METKPAPKLDDDARAFVVQRLACFNPPSTVVKEVRDIFGFEITAQSVEAYDPTKRAGRSLGERWRTIFETTRAAFLAETASIGIAHKSFRLRRLQQLLESAERSGNLLLALHILEQAAKEMGGMYTNRRELTGGKARGPTPPAPVAATGPSPEMLSALYEVMLEETEGRQPH